MIASVAGVLKPALEEHPHAIALVGPGGVLTYSELDRAANAAAGALWSLGVRPGDRVAGCMPNDVDIVVGFHGAQRIGALWVGVAEAYTAAEQWQLIELSDPKVILAGEQWKVEHPGALVTESWRAAVAARTSAPDVHVDPFAPAAIAFTSGTTGTPKGIVHSQHNLILPGAVLKATRGWGTELRKGDSLPMTILNMLVLNTLAAAQAMGCAILIERRDIEGIVSRIVEHKVNVWNGAPAQIYDLARKPHLDVGSLNELWSGGSDTSDALRAELRAAHGSSINATYGLTEAPTVVAIDPVGSEYRTRASGLALPHLDVAAYDERGARLRAGAVGELRIEAAKTGEWANFWRTPLGTWQAGQVVPHGTPGVVATGDIGSVDADGWVTLLDRQKLVVVRGGANVYPTEVERIIRHHPGVQATVVFGVPDDRLGERVAALVVGRDVEFDELLDVCQQHLAKYKIPEVWGRVASLRTNAMGKVNRANLGEVLKTAEVLRGS